MSASAPSKEKLLKIFDEYNLDKDEGSSTLDKQEAMSAFMTLFPHDSPSRILRKIQQVDLNHDGELSKEEFLKIGSKFFFTYRERIFAMIRKYENPNVTDKDIDTFVADVACGSEEMFLEYLKEMYGDEPDRDEFDEETGTIFLGQRGEVIEQRPIGGFVEQRPIGGGPMMQQESNDYLAGARQMARMKRAQKPPYGNSDDDRASSCSSNGSMRSQEEPRRRIVEQRPIGGGGKTNDYLAGARQMAQMKRAQKPPHGGDSDDEAKKPMAKRASSRPGKSRSYFGFKKG